jgi:hypothetical protein
MDVVIGNAGYAVPLFARAVESATNVVRRCDMRSSYESRN